MNNSAPIAFIFIYKPFRKYMNCKSIIFFCGVGCGKDGSVDKWERGGGGAISDPLTMVRDMTGHTLQCVELVSVLNDLQQTCVVYLWVKGHIHLLKVGAALGQGCDICWRDDRQAGDVKDLKFTEL